MKKKIMILGGGINQYPLIEKAKEIGFFTILCDYDECCLSKQICDKFYSVSIFDKEAITSIAKSEKVNGITTNSEPILCMVSEICESLNLPTIPSNVMQRFCNKDIMRDWLAQRGIKDVKYKLCHTQEEAISFYHSINCSKSIMKPQDNSSSRGVYSITSQEDIVKNFATAQKSNRQQNGVLLEEYIEGVEFTVDGFCCNGKHTTLAISEKKHFEYNENVANELYFSYFNNNFDYDNLRLINDQIVHTAGLNFGMTHAEYKYQNGKYHLIEIAARGGGAFISTKIVPFLANIDTVRLLLEFSVGINNQPTIQIDSDSKNKVAILKFFDVPNGESGTVKNIKGIDILENNKNIINYCFNFKVGDFIKPAANDAERIGHYIACADTKEKLDSLVNKINNNVNIEII